MLDFDLIFGKAPQTVALAPVDPPAGIPAVLSEPPFTVRQPIQGGCCAKKESEYRLIGNGFSPQPLPLVDPLVLVGPKVDPFASVAIPSPMAGPPAAIPNYLIPATGEPALPLKVTPLTDKERGLDSKAVAAAGYVAVRSSPGFKEWPFGGKLTSWEVERMKRSG